VGEAPALLAELQAAIRDRIGDPARAMEHTTDVLVQETARCWPVRHMVEIARQPNTSQAGEAALLGVAVVTAKIRENIEARWNKTHEAGGAFDLIARAVVIEFANLWFGDPATRIALCKIIGAVRAPD
jgi:hypothetical protein